METKSLNDLLKDDQHIENVGKVTVRFLFNVSEKMETHLRAAGVSTIPFLKDYNRLRYNRSFDADGKFIGFTSIPMDKSERFNVSDKVLHLDGYIFDGWRLIVDGVQVLAPGLVHNYLVSEPNLPSSDDALWRPNSPIPQETKGSEYDFYAQWTPIDYTVSYAAKTANGHTLPWIVTEGTRSIEEGHEVVVTPSVEGYEFIGWLGQDDMVPTLAHPIVEPGIGDVQLVAVFREKIKN